MKGVIVSVILLVVGILGLAVPWYSVPTSQMGSQTQTYTNLFAVATTSYQLVTVYTLPSPVTIQTANQGGQCAAAWHYCNVSAMFQSQNFILQSGATYTVSVIQCQDCNLFIFGQTVGSTNFDILGSGTKNFTAWSSDTYWVYVANLENNPDTVSSISITGSIPQNVVMIQTHIAYATTSGTQYSQTMVSPYQALGPTTSATVLVLLAIIVVVAIVLERGLISVSVSPKRRRKRRK